MSKITEKNIKDKLMEVMDPELNISIVDLGLVYKIDKKELGNLPGKNATKNIVSVINYVTKTKKAKVF